MRCGEGDPLPQDATARESLRATVTLLLPHGTFASDILPAKNLSIPTHSLCCFFSSFFSSFLSDTARQWIVNRIREDMVTDHRLISHHLANNDHLEAFPDGLSLQCKLLLRLDKDRDMDMDMDTPQDLLRT